MPLNLAHGVQMLFSIHNFYFPDPCLTRQTNMVHTSSLLMVFGVFSLLHPKQFWKDTRLWFALFLSFIFAFVLPATLDHMDQFYIETAVILLMLAALPALKNYRLLIPIVLITFHFQWLYFYLGYGEVFNLGPAFFLVPVMTDLMFVLYCIIEWSTVRKIIAPLYLSLPFSKKG